MPLKETHLFIHFSNVYYMLLYQIQWIQRYTRCSPCPLRLTVHKYYGSHDQTPVWPGDTQEPIRYLFTYQVIYIWLTFFRHVQPITIAYFFKLIHCCISSLQIYTENNQQVTNKFRLYMYVPKDDLYKYINYKHGSKI